MAQLTLTPFEKWQVRTSKVRAMLVDLGLLPSDTRLIPCFGLNRRTSMSLLNRALGGSADVEPFSNERVLTNSINAAFSIAYGTVLIIAANALTLNGEPITVGGVYLSVGN